MPAPTYIDSQAGKLNKISAIQSSTGAPDADKIPATGSNGKIALSLQAAETYVHNQGIPAFTWTVNHNLGKKPSITVLDTASREIEVVVEHVSDNQAVLTLGVELSGTAHAN